ncbi:MAG: hypothetical protein PHW15_02920 [Patescibacteria group bacterium]|jgi:hypothetical protein|nr:hypothetical protein [Patescibacteria group bacterium]MDD5172835.1 hypothetical protein [Patescibacteria group bacterium]
MDLQKDLGKDNSSDTVKKTGLFKSLFKKRKTEEKLKKESVLKNLKQTSDNGDLGISLMPAKAIIIPRIVHSRSLFLIAAIIVIINIFIITWLYLDWHFEKIENAVAEIEREIQFMKTQSLSLLNVRDEIAVLEKNAARAESILNNHIYWTKFFSLLEKYTISDVFFNDFTADTSGIIRLDSVGRDLISIAKQFVIFSQAPDFVKQVDVSDVVNTVNGIRATYTLVLEDNVFKR